MLKNARQSLRFSQSEEEKNHYRERQCRLFLKTITNLGGDDGVNTGATASEDGSVDLFLSMVDKVIVGDELRFVLRDGTEWEA